MSKISLQFQSTPPVKAATKSNFCFVIPYFISIHAAREGGDWHRPLVYAAEDVISIHAAREGGDMLYTPP